MVRTFCGGTIGFAVCVVLISAWGFRDGMTDGLPTARLAPGWEAGAKSGFVYSMYLWPLAFAIGGGIGAAAGFGSWLVKPRSAARTRR